MLDYDEFLRLLRQEGCTVRRATVRRWPDGRICETYAISIGEKERTLQIGPGDRPLAESLVASIVRDLGLPLGRFR